MENIIVFGFSNEYESIDIDTLSKKFNVKKIQFNPIVVSVFLRLNKVAPKIFSQLFKYLIDFSLKGLSGKWTLVCSDNELYMNSLCIDSALITRKVVIIRNTITKISEQFLLKGVDYYSFDKGDCNKYGFNYYEQYCSGSEIIKNDKNDLEKYPEVYDLYFLGLDKGRKVIVESISNVYDNGKNKIIIVNQAIGIKDKIKKYLFKDSKFSGISYQEHINNVLMCKVVIDINQVGQNGITMRPIEALLAEKKLVTNNKKILEYDFYHPNNILIIDSQDDLTYQGIIDFIQLDFIKNTTFDNRNIVDFFSKSVFGR
ncbi:hypothetical protein [Vibrio splendidus]|uniref:Lipopolysaccharide biosynthesis protein n=1 Tax=Vibrio splendidus TaxID=29497 RepID=A0A2T5E6R4_VIBSP|nr:hypothetical protein [Vibrio splendidus]OEE51101.1 hypothetical protein A147_07120 [Vibrio splendidus FF-6]PTP15034.1 hypothetical protein CWO36_20220 [Vibrio splendidus]